MCMCMYIYIYHIYTHICDEALLKDISKYMIYKNKYVCIHTHVTTNAYNFQLDKLVYLWHVAVS